MDDPRRERRRAQQRRVHRQRRLTAGVVAVMLVALVAAIALRSGGLVRSGHGHRGGVRLHRGLVRHRDPAGPADRRRRTGADRRGRRHGDGEPPLRPAPGRRRVDVRRREAPADRRRGDGQPRGHAGLGRRVQVRRRQQQLLRVPHPALLRPLAQAGGLHRHEPGQQPRPRLRALGPAGDRRGPHARGDPQHRAPRDDGDPEGGRADRGDPGLRALPVGRPAAGHRGRQATRAGRRAHGPDRDRDLPRRRGGERQDRTSRRAPRAPSARTAATCAPSPTR